MERHQVNSDNNQCSKIRKTEVCFTSVGNPSDNITWFCCADKELSIFEKQYPLCEGMTYNSYIIEDEKLTVIDTVDHAVENVWRDALNNFLASRSNRTPDYLIVQHLEPDHSAAVEGFMRDYPMCKLVCSAKAATMIDRFASDISRDRIIPVKDGDELEIGSRSLHFVMAPMVHWPEVMVTYDPKSHTLFAADAFGTFGTKLALKAVRREISQSDFATEWADEARRYFINICGKYGVQVQSLLKKGASLDIKYLCPLHGPVLNPAEFNPIPLYNIWSSYAPQYPEKVLVLAASLHGNTVEAAHQFGRMLAQCGVQSDVIDLAEADLSEAVSRAFAYGATVFMSSTYDGSIVPSMQGILARMKSKNWQKRIVGIVENGSWAPIAGKVITKELAEMKGIEIVGETVTIMTRLDETSKAALRNLAETLSASLKAKA